MASYLPIIDHRIQQLLDVLDHHLQNDLVVDLSLQLGFFVYDGKVISHDLLF